MKIPIRHSFIRLILLVEACLLIKGEKCWMPMVCDGKPTWKDDNKRALCAKEEEKALKALTEQLDGMESKLYQLKKTIEELNTNSVPPSVVGFKETTTPQAYKDKKTSSVRSTVPATSPWSTKEAFLSTVRQQTTKVEHSTECGVVYESKCFRAIVYDAYNVTLSVAESICESKLANIYDVSHYSLIQKYLRSIIPERLSWIHVRTGMTYNHKNGQLNSTTGQAISLPTEVWRSGAPFSDASRTTVVVDVNRDPESIYQGIRNVPPSNLFHGAICENE